jgi:hypothetical protein
LGVNKVIFSFLNLLDITGYLKEIRIVNLSSTKKKKKNKPMITKGVLFDIFKESN